MVTKDKYSDGMKSTCLLFAILSEYLTIQSLERNRVDVFPDDDHTKFNQHKRVSTWGDDHKLEKAG